jgi:hypothetical protein
MSALILRELRLITLISVAHGGGLAARQDDIILKLISTKLELVDYNRHLKLNCGKNGKVLIQTKPLFF